MPFIRGFIWFQGEGRNLSADGFASCCQKMKNIQHCVSLVALATGNLIAIFLPKCGNLFNIVVYIYLLFLLLAGELFCLHSNDILLWSVMTSEPLTKDINFLKLDSVHFSPQFNSWYEAISEWPPGSR